MAVIHCKMCGGEVELASEKSSQECPYCGTLTTFPKVVTPQVEQIYNRAEHFRRACNFDKAVSAYEQLVQLSPDDPEAYWGLVISRFGIEYVKDPVSQERIPTCHRVQMDSILVDADYQSALEKSDGQERAIYEREAQRISEIQKDILKISAQEKPYDVFICYKETTDGGTRTKDSVLAQDIYYQLTNNDYKVFFSRITLEGKLGQQYEPYIFAALNSAKVMLVIGSKREYFDAAWVRNEWSRFLAMMKKDKSKLLIPCFRDMDAYDMPEELSMFQAQDMGKIGFIQDILHGVEKVLKKSAPAAAPAAAAPAAAETGANNPLLKRIELFIESGKFDSAQEYCERVLDKEPQNGWAYFYRAMAEAKIMSEQDLIRMPMIDKNPSFIFAQRFADDKLREKLSKLTVELERFKKVEEIRNDIARKTVEFKTWGSDVCIREFKRIALLRSHLVAERELNRNPKLVARLQGIIASSDKFFRGFQQYINQINGPLAPEAMEQSSSQVFAQQKEMDSLFAELGNLPDTLRAIESSRRNRRMLGCFLVILIIFIIVWFGILN